MAKFEQREPHPKISAEEYGGLSPVSYTSCDGFLVLQLEKATLRF